MKFIGKLQDGTVFVKKGYDEEEPFEFKTDEGVICTLTFHFSSASCSLELLTDISS